MRAMRAGLIAAVALAALVLLVVAIAMLAGGRAGPEPPAPGRPAAIGAAGNGASTPKPLTETADSRLGEDLLRAGIDGVARKGTVQPAFLAQAARIDAEVKLLKSESLEDSLKMLSEVEMFYWPGVLGQGDMVSMPLPESVGQIDVEAIMSNRRVLKVADELSRVPKGQAARLLGGEIDATMPAYLKLFEDNWGLIIQGQGLAKPGMRTTAGPSLQISNNADHSPTFAGARLKILSLVLIAGDLGLSDARPSMLKVCDEARRQRDRCYSDTAMSEMSRFMMLTKGSLYSRQILATGLEGTSSAGEGAGQQDTWEKRRLTKYDAAATPYDILTRGGGPTPANFSKGEVTLRFRKPMDDKAFDARRAIASKFRLGGQAVDFHTA